MTTLDLAHILTASRRIAVVGCSPRPTRPSHRIARYLIEQGYVVNPVNPGHREILGLECFPSLADLPSPDTVDIVNIFRRPIFTADIVREVLQLPRSEGRPVIWTQLGVSSEQARIVAEGSGLPYIANRCILVAHSQLVAD